MRVVDPDGELPAASDLARLFPRVRSSSAELDRLARAPRVEVRAGSTVVGVAVYQRADAELRVRTIALAPVEGVHAHAILNLVIDALETMCLAGGGRRLVLARPPRAHALLRRRGYEVVSEGCAGAWVEKVFG